MPSTWCCKIAIHPSVIVEAGFVTNTKDAALLTTNNHMAKVAEAIADGVEAFKASVESD